MISNLSNNLPFLHKREAVTKWYEQLASNTTDIVKRTNVMLRLHQGASSTVAYSGSNGVR